MGSIGWARPSEHLRRQDSSIALKKAVHTEEALRTARATEVGFWRLAQCLAPTVPPHRRSDAPGLSLSLRLKIPLAGLAQSLARSAISSSIEHGLRVPRVALAPRRPPRLRAQDRESVGSNALPRRPGPASGSARRPAATAGVVGAIRSMSSAQAQRRLEVAGLQAPRQDIVLQPQQNAPGCSSAATGPGAIRPLGPSTCFSSARRSLLRMTGSAMEHVEHDLDLPALQRDQEMRGKIDAVAGPAGGARGVQPEHAERDGQAAAALDDADEVGVDQVVVGFAIAAIAEVAGQQLRQRRQPASADPRRRSSAAGSPPPCASSDRCRRAACQSASGASIRASCRAASPMSISVSGSWPIASRASLGSAQPAYWRLTRPLAGADRFPCRLRRIPRSSPPCRPSVPLRRADPG